MKAANLTYFALLVFVFGACVSISSAQTGNAASPPPLGKLIDVGGYRVHLYCTGSGRPAVIIVGAGYSFDWGLVQPEVARFTQVCTYDHSGTGWSDSGPADSCALRIHEIHTALHSAGVEGPYVLVGHSLGALVARLYTAQYPDETAGLVFVDHAFHLILPLQPPPAAKSDRPTPVPTGAGGMDSDPNFKKLPVDNQQLHVWADRKNPDVYKQNLQVGQQCFAEADALGKQSPHPLGNRPLVDISTDSATTMSGYAKFQSELLSLSSDSKQIVATNSSHFVIIDRPDVVVDGIRQVVEAIRKNGKVSEQAPSSAHKP